mgnify:FL=1
MGPLALVRESAFQTQLRSWRRGQHNVWPHLGYKVLYSVFTKRALPSFEALVRVCAFLGLRQGWDLSRQWTRKVAYLLLSEPQRCLK